MAGMMGKHMGQVCRGEDPREAIAKDKGMHECDSKDFKQPATSATMSAKALRLRPDYIKAGVNLRLLGWENGER